MYQKEERHSLEGGGVDVYWMGEFFRSLEQWPRHEHEPAGEWFMVTRVFRFILPLFLSCRGQEWPQKFQISRSVSQRIPLRKASA